MSLKSCAGFEAKVFQDERQGTQTCESRLKQFQSDKSRKQQPPGAEKMREKEAKRRIMPPAKAITMRSMLILRVLSMRRA